MAQLSVEVSGMWQVVDLTTASGAGFILDTICVNYGLIALLVLGAGIPIVWFGYLSPYSAALVGGVVCVAACVWFWLYTRSLWLGFGYYVDHNVLESNDALSCLWPLDDTENLPGRSPAGRLRFSNAHSATSASASYA